MDRSDSKPAEQPPETTMGLRPEHLCEVERYCTEMGGPVFMYDEELDVFRFPEDGRLAFCEEFADWMLMRERGYLDF